MKYTFAMLLQLVVSVAPPLKRKAAASSVKTSNLGINDERSGAKGTQETVNHIYEAYPF